MNGSPCYQTAKVSRLATKKGGNLMADPRNNPSLQLPIADSQSIKNCVGVFWAPSMKTPRQIRASRSSTSPKVFDL